MNAMGHMPGLADAERLRRLESAPREVYEREQTRVADRLAGQAARLVGLGRLLRGRELPPLDDGLCAPGECAGCDGVRAGRGN